MTDVHTIYDSRQHCTALKESRTKTVSMDCPHRQRRGVLPDESGGGRPGWLHAVGDGSDRHATRARSVWCPNRREHLSDG